MSAYQRHKIAFDCQEKITKVIDIKHFGYYPASMPSRINSRSRWDDRCTAVLLRVAGRYSNGELADLIEQQTGQRFTAVTISRRRAALGLPCPRTNNWTNPLRRWAALARR